MSTDEITRYPENEIKMYRLTFDMKKRGHKTHQFITIVIPAVSEEAVRDTVHGFCFEISEATNNKYVTPNDQTITVYEVDKARLFTENADYVV